MFDSPRLVDFAIRLVNFVLNLPIRKGKLLGGIHSPDVPQDKRFSS